MRHLIAVVVGLTLHVLAWSALPLPASSVTDEPVKPSRPKATKPVAKQVVGQDVASRLKPKAPKPQYVRATSSAAATMAVAPALTAGSQAPAPEAGPLAVAPEAGQLHTGHMVCELGNSVTVTPHPQQPSHFVVQMKKTTYYMAPVETTTGAVRFEDAQAGAVWLQLPHKSMLMNSKLGQRMADECQSEHQIAMAQRMKLDPPPSLLDQPTLANK